jgi:hypothetical protein
MDRRIGSVLFVLLVGCSGATSTTGATAANTTSPAGGASAMLKAPEAVAMGPDGMIYLSDCAAQRIFRLGTDGQPTVVAGSGPEGFEAGGLAGDGGLATEARLNCPAGLAFDPKGNLFVGDTVNNRVRMIDPSGVITTAVGSGPVGLDAGAFAGDGGPASEAGLNFPNGIAFDESGNLYIADHGNDAIRKVDKRGVITTVAGTGVGGYSGDGGAATHAMLHGPWCIVIDARGSLYFTEKENDLVRKVDRKGIITTVAGTAGAVFKETYGLARDAAGNLYVSDDIANVILKIGTGGGITTFAGTGKKGHSGDGGPAIAARLTTPFELFLDPASNLYVADGGNGCVRMIDPAGTITSLVCGGSGA